MERALFGNKVKNHKHAQHVFVAGLARSGTTILLNALHQSTQFASLTYGNMPFVLAPNLWRALSSNDTSLLEQPRAHNDGILISTASAEAFEEVFWKTFADQEPQLFNTYINLICHCYEKKRYLSKNNQNIRRLALLHELVPEALFLIPVRDPVQHALSLLNQHQRFKQRQKEDAFTRNYMRWIGHSEFGLDYQPLHTHDLEWRNPEHLNHWLEQWLLTYQHLDNGRFEGMLFLDYDALCIEKGRWQGLQERLSLQPEPPIFRAAPMHRIPANVAGELIQACRAFHQRLLDQEIY